MYTYFVICKWVSESSANVVEKLSRANSFSGLNMGTATKSDCSSHSFSLMNFSLAMHMVVCRKNMVHGALGLKKKVDKVVICFLKTTGVSFLWTSRRK